MYIEKELQDQLKALSKEIFGSQSKYQKFLKNGTLELITRKQTETVPGENGEADTTKEVDVPVLTANGTKQFKQVYYTPESLLEKLQKMKVIRDEFLAQMKKQQDEQAAAAKAKKDEEDRLQKIKEDLTGSAIS